MTRLLAWLILCLLVSWLLRGRPGWIAGVTLLLSTLVPSVAGYHFTGIAAGTLAFHPSDWLILGGLLMQVITNPIAISRAVARHPYAVMIVMIFAAGAFITSRTTGSGGTRLLVDQVVAPFALFLLVVAHGYRNKHVVMMLRNVMLIAMAAESVLVLIQSALGRAVLWESDYPKIAWFTRVGYDRWLGSTDSPLALSLGLAVAGGLALGVGRGLIRFPLLILYLLAMLITQSRTGAVALILIILFSILRSHMALWARALTTAAVVVTGYIIASSNIVAGLVSRVSNDTGSTDARVRAVGFVLGHLSQFLVAGGGLISSYTIARNAGLQTSLESSYLMYVVDTGFILATLYFGLQMALILRYGRQQALLGGTLAALMGALIQHTFSSTGFSNFNGMFIWAIIGLVVAAHSLTAAPDLNLVRIARGRERQVQPHGQLQGQPVESTIS